MADIRTRIAPSPTGFAHLGTAYTALFNLAFARKNKGAFIIRIEDTDRKRHVLEAEQAIFESLSWLGIDWDESTDKGGKYAPYRQSERLGLYEEKIKELLKKDLAYEDDGAIRFRNPGKDVSWDDLIHGKITFPGGEITDFVIKKSDGFPTYNFAVVVDDIEMKITHVIRGEEHISNTPRQLALYKAFGEKPPSFAHHPTLRNKDHKKLSKRRDPVDLRIFRVNGYLPEALVNFLCLLGWSHPDEKEIFGLAEFEKLFDLKRVRKSGPIFDTEKLDWINSQYIQNAKPQELQEILFDFYKGKYDKQLIVKLVPLVNTRMKTLKDFDQLCEFFVTKPKVNQKMLGKNYEKHLKAAIEALEKNTPLDEVPKKNDFKVGDFFMDLRIAITGQKITPPINESIEILGKGKTLERIISILK